MRKAITAMLAALTVFVAITAYGASPDRTAADILVKSGVKGGVVVHLGCDNGAVTAALRVNERYTVQGLDADQSDVDAARKSILLQGLYGQVTVRKYAGGPLPYADNFVNLLVADQAVDTDEAMRVLAPLGVLLVKQGAIWKKTVKPWPAEITEWTHYLNGPDNNAVAQDSVIGIPRSLQWVAGPRWGRTHEELASMSGTVTSKGRMFSVVDYAPHASLRYLAEWRLDARDAFNGTLLWSREIPLWTDHLRHFRSGPLHLPRRMVADGDRLFVTLGLDAPIEVLDAASGKTLRAIKGTEQAEEMLLSDGVLYAMVGPSEVDARGEGLARRGKPLPRGERFLAAYNADSGKQLWKRPSSRDGFVMPLSLTVRGDSVYFFSSTGVVRLNAKDGEEVWRTPRPMMTKRQGWSGPTMVATDEVVLLSDRMPDTKAKGADVIEGAAKVEWGVHGWTIPDFPRRGKSKLVAYSTKDGKALWECSSSENYNAPADVFVIDGLVWVGTDFSKAYDLQTGEVKKEISTKGDQVGMAHHRCYRNKATTEMILTGKSGVEILDLNEGWQGNNSWIRGTCQYGIMPANGFIYVPPDACGCFPKVRQPGFNAMAAERLPRKIAAADRLEKGPAYAKASAGKPVSGSDWPMYRRDVRRSGSTTANVGANLSDAWTAKIGGRLTQPVVANGLVYLSQVDTHTIHALDADSGKTKWTYTSGGRIDSSPTIHKGLVLFGATDGRVYALDAATGVLAWRFLAAPDERQIGSYEQIESAWPVHGAVLVQNDEVLFGAGRSSYIDGGIRLYRLDATTGKQLSMTIVTDLDPETGKQTGKEGKGAGLGFDMEGVRTDILSGDGETVYLRHLRYDAEGKSIAETDPHVFSVYGFLGEEWFIRTYWLYGTMTGAGWGGWAKGANASPSGRVICVDDKNVYGYGRVEPKGAAVGHRAEEYHLFSMDKNAQSALGGASKGKGKAKNPRREAAPKEDPIRWALPSEIIARAMVATSDKLIVAGTPDAGIKSEAVFAYDNEEEARKQFDGKGDILLRVVSLADGKTLSERKLPAKPVLDGVAVVDGKVIASLLDGNVICLSGK